MQPVIAITDGLRGRPGLVGRRRGLLQQVAVSIVRVGRRDADGPDPMVPELLSLGFDSGAPETKLRFSPQRSSWFQDPAVVLELRQKLSTIHVIFCMFYSEASLRDDLYAIIRRIHHNVIYVLPPNASFQQS